MDEWREAHLDLLQNIEFAAEDRLRALKWVRTSVRRHSKIHGRRGYLDFIVGFV